MSNDPRLIGNICARYIAPCVVILTGGILMHYENDIKTLGGLLAFVVSVCTAAVLFGLILPFCLNAINRWAVGRWRNQWVETHIVDFCQILVQKEDGLEALRQTNPTTVGGGVARSVVLEFCSQNADYWLKCS